MKDSEQQYAQTGLHILGPHSDVFMTHSVKCWKRISQNVGKIK